MGVDGPGSSSSSSSSSSAANIDRPEPDAEPDAKKRRVDEEPDGEGDKKASTKDTSNKNPDIVTLDVSGTIFKMSLTLIRKHPGAFLDNLTQCWSENEDEVVFVERDPVLFRYIMAFYRSGRIQLPMTESVKAMKDEIDFFLLPCSVDMIEADRPGDYRQAVTEREQKLDKELE